MISDVSVGVFAIIADARGNVLLCHRTDYDFWNLPGGRLEASEAPLAGVIRETRDVRGFAPDAFPSRTFAEHAERIHDALGAYTLPVLTVPRVLSAALEQREERGR